MGNQRKVWCPACGREVLDLRRHVLSAVLDGKAPALRATIRFATHRRVAIERGWLERAPMGVLP